MATKPAPPPLADRVDVHKSCKSLEVLLSVLNDYCEAAGTIVTLQKKLAKALHETAGMKTTGEIAANALNTSATIFEVSSDIDSKFAKFVDKEYDNISAEVKKWFKKLAKEEKLHDERMANANARIKQAGQVYEKKTKKNPRDATEEHARYINLITQLGPEISQEKYNHALNVTQRHGTTTFGTAACLSRIADAEWLKTCEGVRRFSPTIGQLGEWRSLCEGGWLGPVPPDLVDVDESQQPQPDREVIIEKQPGNEDIRSPTTLKNVEPKKFRESTEQLPLISGPSSVQETEPPREQLQTRSSPTLARTNHQSSPHAISRTASTAPSAFEPPLKVFADRNNTDSVRSLSAFPLPPTHFPIPPPRIQQSSQSQSSQSSSSHHNMPGLTESPLLGSTEDNEDQPSLDTMQASPKGPPSPEQKFQEKPRLQTDAVPSPNIREDNHIRHPIPVKSQTSLPVLAAYTRSDKVSSPSDFSPQELEEDSFNADREFGMNIAHAPRLRATNTTNPPILERTDTGGSNGSIVAAMRNRYTNPSGATSPTLREAPRLPVNVNDLASRYQPTDEPTSPRLRTPSASSRQLPLPPGDGSQHPRQGDYHQDRSVSGRPMPFISTNTNSGMMSPRIDEASRQRQQRFNDLAQLELKEKELALEQRERDINRRARELERDRARLDDVHEANEYENPNNTNQGAITPQPYPQLRPRERKTSFRTQRPSSQLDSGNSPVSPGPSPSLVRPQSQYSYSTSNLIPPSNPMQPSYSQDAQSQHSYTSQYSHSPTSSQQFPPSSPSNSTGLRPPAEPVTRSTEKSKPGWIRRLSMPVGNAFNLDSSKKGNNLAGIGSGQGRTGVFSMDGKKNISSSALRVQEDGRRSYDASGISHRSSTTNLGLGKR